MKYKLILDENNYLEGFVHTNSSEDKYELNPQSMQLDYLNCYHLVEDEVVFDEEKYNKVKEEEEKEKQKPTFEEKIEAQVLYTALMTDTMLDEEEE